MHFFFKFASVTSVFDVVCHLSTGLWSTKKMYVAFGNIRRPLALLPLTMSVLPPMQIGLEKKLIFEGHESALSGSCAGQADEGRRKWEGLPKHVVLDKLIICKSMYIFGGTVWLDDAANGRTREARLGRR